MTSKPANLSKEEPRQPRKQARFPNQTTWMYLVLTRLKVLGALGNFCIVSLNCVRIFRVNNSKHFFTTLCSTWVYDNQLFFTLELTLTSLNSMIRDVYEVLTFRQSLTYDYKSDFPVTEELYPGLWNFLDFCLFQASASWRESHVCWDSKPESHT